MKGLAWVSLLALLMPIGARAMPEVTGSSGSSIVLGPKGPLLTNAHVVEACSSIRVTLPSGSWVTGHVRRLDPTGDMALIDAPVTGGVSIHLRNQPGADERIWVAGHPGGAYDPALVTGMAEPAQDSTDTFGVKARVESGDSGGPVFDGYGNVVGMTFAGADGHAGGYAIKGWRLAQFLQQAGVSVPSDDALQPMAMDRIEDRAGLISLRVLCYRGLPEGTDVAQAGNIQAPPVSSPLVGSPDDAVEDTGIEPAAVAPP